VEHVAAEHGGFLASIALRGAPSKAGLAIRGCNILVPQPHSNYVDPDHDVVAVVRWIDGEALDGFLKRLLAAVDQG
jgi:hypothetical protein